MNKIRIATLLSMLLMLYSNISAQTTEDKIVQPEFPGGRKELLKYMEKNLDLSSGISAVAKKKAGVKDTCFKLLRSHFLHHADNVQQAQLCNAVEIRRFLRHHALRHSV